MVKLACPKEIQVLLRWQGKSLRVLIVEDDAVARIFLIRTVERIGLTADGVSTASEAYPLLQRYCYDLVWLDAHLPDSHGRDVALFIRKRVASEGTRILFSSTDDSIENVEKCLSAGANEFVLKPFSVEDIHRLLHKWLQEDDAPA